MKLQKLREHLSEALGYAEMRSAHFNQDDELIKTKTKLWRETWLIPSIREALEMVEEEISKKKKK